MTERDIYSRIDDALKSIDRAESNLHEIDAIFDRMNKRLDKTRRVLVFAPIAFLVVVVLGVVGLLVLL